MTKTDALLTGATLALGGVFLYKNRKKIKNSITSINRKELKTVDDICNYVINKFTKKEEIIDVQFKVIN